MTSRSLLTFDYFCRLFFSARSSTQRRYTCDYQYITLSSSSSFLECPQWCWWLFWHLGGVRKVHISVLVTSPKNWVVALSFSPPKRKKERTSWTFNVTFSSLYFVLVGNNAATALRTLITWPVWKCHFSWLIHAEKQSLGVIVSAFGLHLLLFILKTTNLYYFTK